MYIYIGHDVRKNDWNLQPGKVQISLLSYRDKVDYWNFACSKYSNLSFMNIHARLNPL